MRLAGLTNQPYAANMAGIRSGSHKPLLLIALMAAIVIVLAVVQYEWSIRVSRAEHDRMQRALDTSVRQFREDFNRELRRLTSGLQSGSFGFSDDAASVYARGYEDWRQRSNYPGLVRSVFLSTANEDDGTRLLRLNTDSGAFEPADWPEHLRDLQGTLTGPPRTPDGLTRLAISPFAWTILYEGPVLAQVLTDAPEWETHGGDVGSAAAFKATFSLSWTGAFCEIRFCRISLNGTSPAWMDWSSKSR